MRPLRLDVAGFTVFREHAVLDLTDADLFALVGPTGSGKSTLLDAMCFALYGTVPRWGKRGGVGGVLAPSSAQARVRLIFEVSGQRYVASRVVRRVGKTIQTKHAGLERLHPDFDLATLDSGIAEEEQLGEVLAGSPAEMESAVTKVIGLPYEQFITCVLLPQGAFAEFLHATPANRQQILVNLLGLGVYDDVRDRATTLATEADAKLSAIDSMLANHIPTDADLTSAGDRLERLRRLSTNVEAALPELDKAHTVAAEAAAHLQQSFHQLRGLDAITVPADPRAAEERLREALTTLGDADIDLTAAEAAEEALLRERDTSPDPAGLAKLLGAYERADELPAEIERHVATLASAEAEHGSRALAAAEAASAAVVAKGERDHARDNQLATVLRGHLTVGSDCPVCLRPVAELPSSTKDARLTEAENALSAARATHDQAQMSARETERAVTSAHAKLSETRDRLARAQAWFADKLDRQAAAAAFAAVEDVVKRIEAAGVELRRLRSYRQTAQKSADAARSALQQSWHAYDRARDAVAGYRPPSADRGDLAGSWSALATWATRQRSSLTAAHTDATVAKEAAEQALATARSAVIALFQAEGLDSTEGNYLRDAAVALERADAAYRMLTEAKQRAERLTSEREIHLSAAQTARSLAQHLNANNFKRWLLAEALDQLVDGASTLLLELSGGQYELGHDKGEFYVIDHYDAEQRRAVRTLSGGETFQAALALALALSDRLAGMSTGATQLGSILLDEGFGTLDSTTLDTVTATLENLAARGDRIVGVVTHVPALAERIPVRFEVRKDARSAYVERVL